MGVKLVLIEGHISIMFSL